jgi:hypothetical protein
VGGCHPPGGGDPGRTALHDAAPPGEYTKAYEAVSAELVSQGYSSAKVKNGWAKDSPYGGTYKGINSSWVTPSGQVFELQFHTADSFEMKQEGTHKLYEEQRKAGTTRARKAEIEVELKKLFASVPIPEGAEGIKHKK